MDVQHVADNDYYFPFEEALGNVVLAFSRDPWVLHNSAVRTHQGSTRVRHSQLQRLISRPFCTRFG